MHGLKISPPIVENIHSIVELFYASDYQSKKAQAQQKAIDYQLYASGNNLSYAEIAEQGEYFYKLAKRYGLVKEFKENGII